MAPRTRWIWQHPDWPNFTFDPQALAHDLAETHRLHGVLEGKASAIGLVHNDELALEATTAEVQATAAIEGERLPLDAVRSSVMRRLGLATIGPRDRHVDGLVAVIHDATRNPGDALDEDRLFRWQSALFPGGTSGLHRIAVGRYRDHADPMQIVSGRQGHEVVHYEAPASKVVAREMKRFLKWFAQTAPSDQARAGNLDVLVRAAIAHLWFETIHPFEDGNGRIGRAIVDMAMAQHLPTPLRLHSLSRQLLASRADYYDRLNRSQRVEHGLDVTDWVRWFAGQCGAAYRSAGEVIDLALAKRRFWEQRAGRVLNERQRKVVQRLLDDGDGRFEGGLNAEKYMKLTSASKATATRDLADLVANGLLWTAGVGKALRYYVNMPGWSHGLARESGDAETTN